MSRFVIFNTVDWACCRAVAAGELEEETAMERLVGRAWLFQASAEVDDVEEAAREAVCEFLSSEQGKQALEEEGASELGWESAIPWVPDEVWARHGLTPLGHPDVERVLLDGEENLLEARAARQAR